MNYAIVILKAKAEELNASVKLDEKRLAEMDFEMYSDEEFISNNILNFKSQIKELNTAIVKLLK